MIGLGILIGTRNNDSRDAASTNDCKTDWKICSDNADLANNYRQYFKLQFECREASKKKAKYGTPEFPWFSFSSFASGYLAPKTGIMVLIESDAQYSNGFGAMVHTKVSCRYDLNQSAVLDVTLDGQ